MKRLALFCDGTWADSPQRPIARLEGAQVEADCAQTNVARLFRVASAGDCAEQCSAYFSGVGSGRLPLLGGAFGEGLEDKILEAYLWLCGLYRFGAAVFLFGFSRGAYSVRSLAGLIRHVGFLAEPSAERAREAMALYRRRLPPSGLRGDQAWPDSQTAAFRERHARAFIEADQNGLRLKDAESGRTAPFAIQFLGVWDTVGALGFPHRWPLSRLFNRRHQFHDTALSRSVAHAAQALAADERRSPLEAAVWRNLPALNAGAETPRYRQAWFPGDHGSVGGGGPERRLSDGALVWMAERAAAAGLPLDFAHDELARARANFDPIGGPLRNAPEGVLSRLAAQKDRAAMRAGDEAHPGALARMRADPGYRPAPLQALWPQRAFDDIAAGRSESPDMVPMKPVLQQEIPEEPARIGLGLKSPPRSKRGPFDP